ncbi:stalk domain-containing protein [Cohnella sp. GCM10027633]|uniref:stalk domain-containing protein n=1 Tax=unclassified Cohnella TaxID=2636738 RepID=UPI0036387D95
MRSITSIIIIVTLLFLIAATPKAAEYQVDEYQVFINKHKVSDNLKIVIKSNSIMLPAAEIFEVYRFKIKKQKDKTTILTDGYKTIEYTIGSKTALVKGMNQYTKKNYGDNGLTIKLPVAPFVVDKVVYLPLSLFSKSLAWDYTVNKSEKVIKFIQQSAKKSDE